MIKLITVITILFLSYSLQAQYGSKKKVYNSFVLLNDALENSRSVVKKNNDRLYFLLIKAHQTDSEKYSNAFEKSDSIRQETQDIINYINNLKVLLIAKTENLEKTSVVNNDTIISLKHIDNFDDYTTPSYILIGENRWEPLEGQYSAIELKNKLQDYKDFLEQLIKEEDQNMEIGINVIDFDTKASYDKWEIANFHNVPLAGVISYLSKIQLDIKIAESDVINYFLQQ